MEKAKVANVSRRAWLSAAFGASIGTRVAVAQQGCPETTPSTGFQGRIGRHAEDSLPAKLEPVRPPAGAPNIVYIVLDDTGFGDLHCYGSEVSTPHMDALAAGGLLYTNFHSKAICSPTRASLLTGRNHHAIGMKELAQVDQGYPHSRGRITPAAATIAQILQSNGYSTYGVGKWHLTPQEEFGPGGDRTHWPLQKGFNRFYGFLSGWTDQYRPNLIEDNRAIPTPERDGYHFSEDIVDQCLTMLGEHRKSAPEKPFFQYIAFGATHAPVQVAKRYIEKYKGRYDKGWDVLRDERYQRQLQTGIIPPGTKLPPRNPGDPAWDSLGAEERAVFARFMEAYAGFLEHTDEQIGRVVQFLKDQGVFENTVVVLLGDNGGAPEAGLSGGFRRPYGDRTPVSEMHRHLDELGSPSTQPLYPRPWASVSSTPFQFYKLWPYRGGVQTPFLLSWPKGVRSPGIRPQFVDVIDVTPTMLDIIGIRAPDSFHGVCQIPMQGVSIRRTFDGPAVPSPRNTQYFELWGSRAIYRDGWKAIGIHTPGTSYDTDRWELYHVAEDFSESTNVAAQHPERLEQLKALWWEEARKNGALPLLEAPGGRKNTYNQALPDGGR